MKAIYHRVAACTGPLLITMISGSCGFFIGATFRL